MTDYLEQPEKQENALLEQAKRLEQALSALALRGETETDAGGVLDRVEDRENSAESSAWERQGLDETLLAVAGGSEPSFTQTPTQGQKEQAELPLLARLRQLDRALEGPGETPGNGTEGHALRSTERAAGWSQAELGAARRLFNQEPSLPQTGWGGYSNSGGREPLQSSGDLTWAEQTDRAFRRDSRRYDGGFYLY